MKNRYLRSVVAPVAAAAIWGLAFVAQSIGAGHVGAFTFTAARSAVAVVALGIVLAAVTLIRRKSGKYQKPSGGIGTLLLGGACCGTVLAIATNLQQMGLSGTDSGKASFITALYIVLVPIFGLFFHRRASLMTAISVAIATVGMYLLCVGNGFSVQGSDIYVIICAFCFAGHILVVDHFAPQVDGIALSLVQFAVMAIESGICMLIFEQPDLASLTACLPQIMYVGVLSSGVAYTLQIVAQQSTDPTMVSLLLSLESVFGAISGAIVLDERMSTREYVGCALMLCAVMLSQIPVSVIRRKRQSPEK